MKTAHKWGLGLFLLWLLGRKKNEPSIPNENPFPGQILTKSAEFDAAVYAIADALNIPANYLFFHMFSESGLDEKAHVDRRKVKTKKGTKYEYKFGLHNKDIFPKTSELNTWETWGGGLFGLVRPFAAPYIGGLSFEDWLRSSDIVQLEGFLVFMSPWAGRIKSASDIRMVGFAPRDFDAPDDKVVYEDNPDNASDAFDVHKYLDKEAPFGKITAGELRAKWTADYNKLAEQAKQKGKPIQVKIYK